MTLEKFQELVNEEVERLPNEFKERLSNVEILTEAWPTEEDLKNLRVERGTTLFGLYRGVPLTKRGNYNAALPDKIAIFAGPIIQACKNVEEVRNQIRNTVLHEIGHHFGMSEGQIRNAERARSRRKIRQG